MKQRPILFSGPMVRALLDGSKTQTRRVGKIQSPDFFGIKAEAVRHATLGYQIQATHDAYPGRGTARHAICVCPYGQPGDQLWVREEHYKFGHWEPVPGVRTKGGRQKWKFVTDTDETLYEAPDQYRKGRHHKDPSTQAWHKRLARFMPRAASRITLEITGVRVERLQAISEVDAIAEGCTQNHNGYYWGGPHPVSGLKQMATAKSAYQDLWESINSPGSWNSNPWVWVIEFKRVAP